MEEENDMSGICNARLPWLICWMLVFALSPLAASAQNDSALKIGLIADTQVTTRERTGYYLFRTFGADVVANVAVRTAAQEHLAVRHLELSLYDVMRTSPDVVLYLGDGANSGCDDELNDFFDALMKARMYWKIPIFFVIGNHDYLATGNQTGRAQRSLACGERTYATKQNIVQRAAEFNRASWESFAKEKGLFTSYVDSLEVMAAGNSGCDVVEEDQDSEGCFYSAVVRYERGGRRGAFVLLDTSDYRDLSRLPELSFFGSIANFRGLRGGVSYRAGGQGDWIGKYLPKGADAGQLFIASHYPSTDLNWLGAASGRLGDLMVGTSNLWLSGHTHQPDPAQRISPDRWFQLPDGNESNHYKEINVGSTTDHRAHAAIVTVANGDAKKVPVLAMNEDAARVCRAWIADLRLTDDYGYPLPNKEDAQTRLGLTKSYRKSEYRSSAAKRNINRLLESAGADMETRIRCLMFLAAEAESM
jgi:predicted phosphodiesterase